MAPRWKFKGAEAKARDEPISVIVSQLQSSFIESNSVGLLTDSNALLAVETLQAELLSRAGFGRAIATTEKGKHWLQLFMEEAFYLFYALKCIKLIKDGRNLDENDVWRHMKLRNKRNHATYKAYSHLRTKNWVVRSGLQYGVDFVAYRHHPSLVHSEYAILVSTEGDSSCLDGRLSTWSDVHCAVRLCGSVAKTLLVLGVNRSRQVEDDEVPDCLESYEIRELRVTRWSAEQNREEKPAHQNISQ